MGVGDVVEHCAVGSVRGDCQREGEFDLGRRDVVSNCERNIWVKGVRDCVDHICAFLLLDAVFEQRGRNARLTLCWLVPILDVVIRVPNPHQFRAPLSEMVKANGASAETVL